MNTMNTAEISIENIRKLLDTISKNDCDDQHRKPIHRDEQHRKPIHRDEQHQKPIHRDDQHRKPIHRNEQHQKPIHRNDQHQKPIHRNDQHQKPIHRNDQHSKYVIPDEQYDPETNWSIVPKDKQKIITEMIGKMGIRDLCVGRVLYNCKLPETASNIAFAKSEIIKKLIHS